MSESKFPNNSHSLDLIRMKQSGWKRTPQQPNYGRRDHCRNISGLLEAADIAGTAFIPKYYSEHLKSINCFHVFFLPISVLLLLPFPFSFLELNIFLFLTQHSFSKYLLRISKFSILTAFTKLLPFAIFPHNIILFECNFFHLIPCLAWAETWLFTDSTVSPAACHSGWRTP